VEGLNYVGMGNSTNKKDAQSNAARDFCQFLVRKGDMTAEDVPAMGQTQVVCCLLGYLIRYRDCFICYAEKFLDISFEMLFGL